MATLTPREVELVTALAHGATQTQLARRWGILPASAAMAASRLRAKVGALTNEHLIGIAYRSGLLPVGRTDGQDDETQMSVEPALIGGA